MITVFLKNGTIINVPDAVEWKEIVVGRNYLLGYKLLNEDSAEVGQFVADNVAGLVKGDSQVIGAPSSAEQPE